MKRTVILLVLVSCLLESCSDTRTSNYASVLEARRAGEFERGWLPAALPDDATNIREIHNVDTNEVWGLFLFPQGTRERLEKQLIPTTTLEVSRRPIRNPHVDWWPEFLTGTHTPGSLSKSDFAFYRSQDRTVYYFALDRHNGRAFFWAVPR